MTRFQKFTNSFLKTTLDNIRVATGIRGFTNLLERQRTITLTSLSDRSMVQTVTWETACRR